MGRDLSPNPSGLCMCGCGRKTSIPSITNARIGRIAGQPMRFIHGHNAVDKERPHWLPEDRGYDTPCWVWQRASLRRGYGQLNHRGAHRFFYEQKHGPIPEGLVIDHLCRVHECVNPDHLEPVTNAENARRGLGTKLTADQVREIRASTERGVDLAPRYGVSQQTICNIRHRRCWRDLEDAA